MGKVVVAGVGGSGVGSDECISTREDLLKGCTAITGDSDDEVAEGTLELTGNASDSQVLAGKTYYSTDPKVKHNGAMVNRGAVNQGLSAGGSFNIPAGYHNGGGEVTANSLASQTPGNASGGHILSGYTAWVNGQKVPGGIPIQNAETDNDRVWATSASNWAGTFNIGVRNGHYLNGVNWVRYDVPNFQPWNIKKGVNIGGVVGTFEGYVPTATDLYLRGNNIAGWTSTSPSYRVSFDAGQITISYNYIDIKAPFSTVGKTYLHVQGYSEKTVSNPTNKNMRLSRDDTGTNVATTLIPNNIGNYTISFNVANNQANTAYRITTNYADGAVFRIWLS